LIVLTTIQTYRTSQCRTLYFYVRSFTAKISIQNIPSCLHHDVNFTLNSNLPSRKRYLWYQQSYPSSTFRTVRMILSTFFFLHFEGGVCCSTKPLILSWYWYLLLFARPLRYGSWLLLVLFGTALALLSSCQLNSASSVGLCYLVLLLAGQMLSLLQYYWSWSSTTYFEVWLFMMPAWYGKSDTPRSASVRVEGETMHFANNRSWSHGLRRAA